MALASNSTICEVGEMQHATFIEKLGDTGAVADALGQKHSTVSMWKKRDVPWRWRGAVARLAKNAKVDVPAGFLGEGERA